MTNAQKIIATMGLVLIFGRFLSAPYHFEGTDTSGRVRDSADQIVEGRVHAPLWAPPGPDEVLDKARVRLRDPELQLERITVQRDWIRLTAWVLAIATITVLAIGAPGSRPPDSELAK